MEPLKFCRVCLVTDVRMYSLDTTSKHSIGVIYSHLAQIQIPDSYQHVCFECASLLQKYQMFKSKCLRAHSILCDVLDNSSVLTKQIIQRIDRKKNKLESNLQKKFCDPYKIVNKYCEDHQLESEVKSEVQTHNYGECSGTKISCEINRSSLKISSEILTNSKKSNTTNCCDSTNDSLCKNSEKHFEVLKIDKEDYQPEFRGSQEKIHESSFTKDCYKDNSETVAKNKNNTFKEHKHKKRKINKEKLKTKIKTNSIDAIHDSVDDFDDNYLTESSDKNVPVEKKKTLTDKSDDMKKELKSKKRKVKSVFYSDDNVSDDEPLLKNANIITDKSKSKKLRLDLEFHNYATVVWLTSDDAIKELVARKESKNYKISPFKCDFCYKGYEAKAAYENHMKRHSADSGAYECEICHLRFPKTEFLCKHKLSCHKRKFSCKLCPYVCYCMYQARTHVSLHKGKKYPCKDCGEIFSMPNSLFMHKRLKHLNDSVEESVCELCGDVFGSPRGLFLHHNKLHRTEKNKKQGPKCEECRIHFTSEIAWKRHLVLSTRHIVTNGCKYCGDRFTNEDDLKSHIRANHQRMPRKKTDIELPAACPLCKVWLSNRIEYKNHMNKQHPQSEEALKLASDNLASYVCEVCGQAFKLQCFLIYHQRKHTGERPYKCQDCGKTFQMSGALSIHRSVHAQKLTYKCDTCAKIFSSKSALNKHMKLHLGIRPHKCTICDKGFLHMCDLRLHIKYVHDKVPWPKKKSKQNIADENVSYEGFN